MPSPLWWSYITSRPKAAYRWCVGRTKAFFGKGKNNKVHLPPEIHDRIIHFVGSRSDLYSLCLVSKAFYADAVRILYRDVQLSQGNTLLYRWLTKTASDERKVGWVVALRFHIDTEELLETGEKITEWATHLGRCLASLVNLRRYVSVCLAVVRPTSSIYRLHISGALGSYPGKKLVEGVSTNLLYFDNDFVPLEAVLSLLSSQKNLQAYHQADSSVCDLPTPFLPDVTEVTLPLWALSHVSSHSLRSVQTSLDDRRLIAREDELFNVCSSHRDTLTTFKVFREPEEASLKIADYLNSLHQNTPLLQDVRVWNSGDLVCFAVVLFPISLITFVVPRFTFRRCSNIPCAV
jgi:hypothetical protein